VSGGANTITQLGVLQIGTDLLVGGGTGDDIVALDGATIGDDLQAKLLAGNNQLTLDDTHVIGDLKVVAGSGDDTVALTGTTVVDGTQSINLGTGNDTQP